MLCDELKTFKADTYGAIELVYAKDEVDEAIAELKAENKRLKRCEIWMNQHFYCEEVIACESAKNRRLKRALWLARAERAVAEQTIDEWSRYREKHPCGSWRVDPFEYWVQAWINVEKLCLKKAKEYK